MVSVDIGNTTISVAWFHGADIIKTRKIPTKEATKKKLAALLRSSRAEPIVVCSVVPDANKLFKQTFPKVYIAGDSLKIPIKSLYDKKSIGMDRLVGAWAAKKLFPPTRLVIDFGTAITLDFISPKGVYQGGVILPGIGSTQKVLSACALLPKKIIYKESKRIIPRDTIESISAGIDRGFSFMINGLIKDYSRRLRISLSTPVIITGGEARVILKHLDFNYIHRPCLVLKGLNLLFNSRDHFLNPKKNKKN